MKKKLTAYDINRRVDLGMYEGPNQFAVLRDVARKELPGGERLSNDAIQAYARKFKHQLDATGTIEITDGDDLPDLSQYKGKTPEEQARAFLAETEPNWARLSAGEQSKKVEALLQQIAEAEGDMPTDAESEADDGAPQLAARAQAIKNLEARDPAFAKLSWDDKFHHERTQSEEQRIKLAREQRRALRDDAEAARFLSDSGAAARSPAAQQSEPVLPTLAELRHNYAGNGDVAKCIEYARTHAAGDSFARLSWDQQVKIGSAMCRRIYAAAPAEERRAGAN
jgi:hypothetical protein